MKVLSVYPTPFLSWRLLGVCAHLHLSMYICDFPTFAFVLTGKLQADWIGYTVPFPFDHPSPALFLSLPLVPQCKGTKPLLWNALTSSLFTLCPLPFVLNLVKSGFA